MKLIKKIYNGNAKENNNKEVATKKMLSFYIIFNCTTILHFLLCMQGNTQLIMKRKNNKQKKNQ